MHGGKINLQNIPGADLRKYSDSVQALDPDLIFKFTDGKIISNITAKFGPLKTVVGQYNAMLHAAGERTDALKDSMIGLAGSNAKLKDYLSSLGKTGEASLTGYIAYLTKANGKTLLLKAATLALNAALQFGISMLVSYGINRIIEEKQKIEDARKAAADSAAEFQETSASLHDLIEQYKTLYSETSGTWDTTTLASVQNIQQQITDLVGDQAEGIELVNGALDEQLALLRNIDVQQAQTWQLENKDVVSRASKYFGRKHTVSVMDSVNPDSAVLEWINKNAAKYKPVLTDRGALQNADLTGSWDDIVSTLEQMYSDLDAYA